MKISTKGRYGLRVMIDLACYPNKRVPLKNIAQRQHITIKYLEQIIAPLVRDGLVKSYRGQNGGYQIARPAATITVGDILRTMEGSLAPVACLEPNAEPCPHADTCPSLDVWENLYWHLENYFDDIFLSTLVTVNGDNEDCSFAEEDDAGGHHQFGGLH